jgi:hypothetical protein
MFYTLKFLILVSAFLEEYGKVNNDCPCHSFINEMPVKGEQRQ